jgi:hypothetical protein
LFLFSFNYFFNIDFFLNDDEDACIDGVDDKLKKSFFISAGGACKTGGRPGVVLG